MSEETKPPMIYKQISKVMKDMRPISKDKQTTGYASFSYRGIDDVYNALQPLLAKHGVFCTTEILERERREPITTKNGGRMFHYINHYRFKFQAEDGSFVTCDADGEATDSGDKTSNKCASIAQKYAFFQTFCIPTADMPDPDAETIAQANTHERAAIAEMNKQGVSLGNLQDVMKAMKGKTGKDLPAVVGSFK
jgi:hypothetical protein